MTRTRYTLDDLGGALPWRALLHFITHLPADSELAKESDGGMAEQAPWLDGSMVAPLLAALVDATNFGRWEYAASVSKRKPRKPKRVRTPWGGHERVRKLGSDPIPVADFEAWWASKDKEA